MSYENETCRPRTLARRDAMRVDLCGCGMLHVTFGAFTIRLPLRVYEAFTEMLVEALQSKQRKEEWSATSTDARPHRGPVH